MQLLFVDNIVTLFRENIKVFHNAFIACFFLITLIWLLKLFMLHKFDIIDFFFVAIVFGGYLIVKSNFRAQAVTYVMVFAFVSVGYLIFAFISLVRLNQKQHAYRYHAFNYLKNAEYDYFVTVNGKDDIRDISISLANKIGLEMKDIKKLKFWELFTEAFDVISVNEHLFNEDYQEEFHNEYLKQNQFNVSYQFSTEVRNEEGEIDHYTILTKPVYYGHKYLGKNIFIDRNRWQILTKLNESMGRLMEDYEKAKAQSHALLSMTTGVLLYYDYQTRTYVMTETFRKVLNSTKSEYSKAELMELIHPDDVQKYVSSLSSINTQEVTSMVFRLKINSKYRKLVEEALYLYDESSMVSVIKTLPIREENSDNVEYIKSVTTPATGPLPTKETGNTAPDDLKSLEEKMQQTDLNRLESILQSALKKRE